MTVANGLLLKNNLHNFNMEKLTYITREGNKSKIVDMSHPDYEKVLAIKILRKEFHKSINNTNMPFYTKEVFENNKGSILSFNRAIGKLNPSVEIITLKN